MADSKKYLDSNGLLYFWQKIKTQLGNKVDKVEGKGLSTNDYTTDEKTKLAGIADGANKTVVDSTLSDNSSNPVQNSTVKAALDAKAAKDHTHADATTSTSGFMSGADKKKLDAIDEGATKITIDSALSDTSTNPVQNKIVKSAIDAKATKATTLAGYGITDAYTKTAVDTALDGKADEATTLAGYGITDAYTSTQVDTELAKKATKATTLSGYGITDAYTETEVDTALAKKANVATTIAGYGITDAYTTTQVDTALDAKAAKATSLSGYGITDAYTKTEIDNKLTSAMRYKGEKETYADLPTTGNVTGDVWNIATADADHGIKAGDNVAWNGTTWDVLSGLMDLSSYLKADSVVTNDDIDTIVRQ
jgi:hypothetical protein